MFASIRRLCTPKTIENVVKYSKRRTVCTFCSNPRVIQPATCILQYPTLGNLKVYRFKSKGSKSHKNQVGESETERESDGDFLDNFQDKNTRVVKVDVTTLRLDAVIKAGLGLSRNKTELIFYESKIRVNGSKVLKKSNRVNEGDEIDIIKGVSTNNPNFLIVARIEVMSIAPKEESINVKLRRCKSLTVENYQGNNVWKS